MTKAEISELEFHLRKLEIKYSELYAYHRWPSERDRWVELVFALVSTASDWPESDTRALVEKLDSLDLLDVNRLAAIPDKGGSLDYESVLSGRLLSTISEPVELPDGTERPGLNEAESKRCVSILHETATSLVEHHGGKVQRYLRKYGQEMLDRLHEDFGFSGLKDEEVKRAFSFWFQNVLNMPIALNTESTRAFCDEVGVTFSDLVEQADAMDINVALVDDFIDQSMADRKPSA